MVDNLVAGKVEKLVGLLVVDLAVCLVDMSVVMLGCDSQFFGPYPSNHQLHIL
jgi:hypothetical protein